MKRTFIALDVIPGPAFKDAYEQIRYRLRLERITWMQDTGLHITLKFLGDTQDDLIPGIIEKVKMIISKYKPFTIDLKDLGLFKNIHEPRVLWIGCDIPEPVQALHEEIERALADFGFMPENRTFRPHLTLGRIKNIHENNQLTQLIAQYKNARFQSPEIDKVVFYESKLTSKGAIYAPIHVFGLTGN